MAKEAKREGKGVLAILLIFSAAAAATAGLIFATRAKAEPEPPPPGLANLYGVVTDAETGHPLSGVLVSLNGWAISTNSGGNYAFIDIDPGAYLLQFSKEGYQTAVY